MPEGFGESFLFLVEDSLMTAFRTSFVAIGVRFPFKNNEFACEILV